MMKTSLRILLLTVLALLTACEKGGTVRQIVYTVDTAAEQHITTHSDAEFDALLERFCGYAEEGSTVTFHGARAGSPRTKDVVTYSTTSRDEIKAWMRDMEAAGMTVTPPPAPGTAPPTPPRRNPLRGASPMPLPTTWPRAPSSPSTPSTT